MLLSLNDDVLFITLDMLSWYSMKRLRVAFQSNQTTHKQMTTSVKQKQNMKYVTYANKTSGTVKLGTRVKLLQQAHNIHRIIKLLI